MLAPSPRTVCIHASTAWTGLLYQWPVAEPGGSLDYTADVTKWLAAGKDSIASVEISLQPSGCGEMQVRSIAVNGGCITARLAGGVAGRDYIARLTVTCVSGRSEQFNIGINVSSVFAPWPPRDPPNWDFGVPACWPVYYNGLTTDGAVLTVINTDGWPTAPDDLAPGAWWLNDALPNAVAGGTPCPFQPLFASLLRSTDLLRLGSRVLPPFDPQVEGQIWLNGVVPAVSLGSFTGLAANGTAVTVVNANGWLTSPEGLPPGAVWINGSSGIVNAVAGAVSSATAPVFLGFLTSIELLAYGAAILPTTDPRVAGQLWLNGVVVCVSAG